MKRALLLILISLLVFSFSSCQVADWFLNMMYPEDSRGNNTINVSLSIDGGIDVTYHPVVVALIPIFFNSATNQTEINFDSIVKEKFYGQTYISWSFSQLGENEYIVIAYQDANDDNVVNADEPSVRFANMDMYGQDTFNFQTTDMATMSGSEYLGNYPAIDADLLSKLSGSTDISSLVIDGRNTLDSNNLGTEYYYVYTNASGLSLQSYTWKLMYASSRSEITCYDATYQNSSYSSLYINFANTSPSLYYSTETLALSVTAIFNDTVNGGTKTLNAELKIYMSQDDPYFWIDGVSSVPRDTTQTLTYNISRNNAKTISTIEYRLVDSYWYTVGYNGYWGYQQIYSPSTAAISIDFNQLSPKLSETYWDDGRQLVLEVYVYYSDGASYYNTYWIYPTAAGTYYNITLNISSVETYGYCDVYIEDYANSNTLQYNYVYLDSYGYGTVYFYNILDCVGTDQRIRVYLYDQNYTYVATQTYDLTGQLEGTQYPYMSIN